MKRLVFQNHLLNLLPLEDTVHWVLFTLSTTYFNQGNLCDTLSSKTRTLITANLPVTWCKSARLIHIWVSDESFWIGTGPQRLCHTVIVFLTCHGEQTIGYVSAQTLDPFLQKNLFLNAWTIWRLWTIETQLFFMSKCSNQFRRGAKVLSFSVVQKQFFRFLYKCIINLLKPNLKSIKRHHVTNFQSDVRLSSVKKSSWKQRREILVSDKGLQPMKVNSPPVINRLPWHGANRPRYCFCVQQVLQYPVSHQAGTSKLSTSRKVLVLFWFTWEGGKKNLFGKADTLVEEILSCRRIKLSNSQTLILDGVETGSFLSDFAQQLSRRNADVPDIYFTLLDAAGMSPTLILHQNANAKEKGNWVPFKIWPSEAA